MPHISLTGKCLRYSSESERPGLRPAARPPIAGTQSLGRSPLRAPASVRACSLLRSSPCCVSCMLAPLRTRALCCRVSCMLAPWDSRSLARCVYHHMRTGPRRLRSSAGGCRHPRLRLRARRGDACPGLEGADRVADSQQPGQRKATGQWKAT